jgi:hypothetical protein
MRAHHLTATLVLGFFPGPVRAIPVQDGVIDVGEYCLLWETNVVTYWFDADEDYVYLGFDGMSLDADDLIIAHKVADGTQHNVMFGENFSLSGWTHLFAFYGAGNIERFFFSVPASPEDFSSLSHFAGTDANPVTEIRIDRSSLGSDVLGSAFELGAFGVHDDASFIWTTAPATNATGPAVQLWNDYSLLGICQPTATQSDTWGRVKGAYRSRR